MMRRIRPTGRARALSRIFAHGTRPKRGRVSWGAVIFLAFLCAAPAFAHAAAQPPEAPREDTQASPPVEPSPSVLLEEPEISPQQAQSLRRQMLQALLTDDFRYRPLGLVDPFVPFISPETTVTESLPETEEVPSPVSRAGLPLTPLQKMNLGEVERGLKAIVWGAMGSRALIEDAAGKGYIVKEGTPLTPDGMVERIYKDALVLRQYVWDPKERQWVPKFVTIRLSKEGMKD